MNPKVDLYLAEGCGRCPLHRTPECKVYRWSAELRELRAIALGGGLTEEVKWSTPTYTHGGTNVAMVFAFNEHAGISFFRGSLMEDPHGLLEFAGPNSQVAKLAKFTSLSQIEEARPALQHLIAQAILLAETGAKVEKIDIGDRPIPEELAAKFDEMPELAVAFRTLTPGRQREYLIHFFQPKQSKTREARIEKCIDRIMAGKGFSAYRDP